MDRGTDGAVNSEQTTWFDEIDLDPTVPWLRMGTRQLGERPWLVVDRHRADELALKQQLCLERHGEVFAAEPSAFEPSREVLELVSRELQLIGVDGDVAPVVEHSAGGSPLHPLDAAGRSVQEDLCLLRRDASGWVLAAASLCFPSRWRLAAKMGRPLAEVHGPVEGYRAELADRVDNLFDRLGERTVWRRNWFIHPDGHLFQPDRPIDGDPTVGAEDCGDHLMVRSERQTLRTLPTSGWVLFTIRIQQATLGLFLADPQRRSSFVRFVEEVGSGHAAHRGVSVDQLGELRQFLLR